MQRQLAKVVWVTGDDYRTKAGGNEHDVGINDVGRACLREQGSNGVSLTVLERGDTASSQEAA